MSVTLQIGGTTYPFDENSFDLTTTVDERQRFQCEVIDYAGSTHFVKGQSVIVTDPVLGVLFNGVLNTSKEKIEYPSLLIRHSIDCIDYGQYAASKRTFTRTYSTSASAGKIALDQVSSILSSEGLTTNYGIRYETTAADFNTGNISNVAGGNYVQDGDLELARAGTDTAISVALGSGTLTNVSYTANGLAPNLTSAIKLTSQLVSPVTSNNIYVTIWTGSITISTGNTLSMDIWVPSTNVEICATIDGQFSDSKIINNGSVGILYDQNNIPSYTFNNNIITDLSSYAENQWYHRVFTFPSAFNGKVLNKIQIGIAGKTAGTFNAYFKNITLNSTQIFSTSLLATPVVFRSLGGFLPSLTSATVVQTYDPAVSSYISQSYSLSATQIVRSSLVQWTTTNANLISIYASYDGNIYLPCANNGTLPTLPSGTNVNAMSIYFKALFPSSPDPTIYASLQALTASVPSAPNPNSAKSDIAITYATQANWNTGTHTGTQALSNGDLTLGTYTRNWNDNTISNQSFFTATGATESSSGGAYIVAVPAASGGIVSEGTSRLDAVGVLSDFTLDIDVSMSAVSGLNNRIGIVYRQTAWANNAANTYAYLVDISATDIEIGYGVNASATSASYTSLGSATISVSANTVYHLKIVVSGTSHSVYFNNATSATLIAQDGTYTAPGNIGLHAENNSASSANFTFDNLVISPTISGTWQSASTSLNSLGTCGGSAISWNEINTSNPNESSAVIKTSIDNGSTYQVCSNGATIPGLTSGVNLSGKNILMQVLLNTVSQTYEPIIRGLVLRVLGQYPGSSGTRTTAPLGNDTSITRTVGSGWGNAFDGQTWTQVGTGTTSVGSSEENIANTTGEVHMVLGSRTSADEEGTVRFSLSNSSITGGMELRYIDSSHYYRIEVQTTSIRIVKNVGSGNTTLATSTISLATGTFYWLRYRVTGQGPVVLQGKVWQSGALEPGVVNGNMSKTNPQWTVTATD